jgi:hypothetical protein
MTVVAIVACGWILAFGLSRRARAAHERAASFDDASVAAARSVLGNIVSTPHDAMHIAARERARLRAMTASNELVRPNDASRTLSAILSRFPSEPPVQTRVLSIQPALCTLTIEAEDVSRAEEFIGAIVPFEGWKLEEPRVDARATGATVSLQWKVMPTRRSSANASGGPP